jgi:hypothetical protein
VSTSLRTPVCKLLKLMPARDRVEAMAAEAEAILGQVPAMAEGQAT